MDPAYLAGFFDGEGCIGIYTRTSKNSDVLLRVAVSATQSEPHHQVLLDIRRIYGGGLHPKINYTDQSSNRWDWKLQKIDGIHRFLTDTLPHLRIKRERALLMLDTLDLRSRITDRDALSRAFRLAAERCAVLNQRGSSQILGEKKGGLAPPSIHVPDA